MQALPGRSPGTKQNKIEQKKRCVHTTKAGSSSVSQSRAKMANKRFFFGKRARQSSLLKTSTRDCCVNVTLESVHLPCSSQSAQALPWFLALFPTPTLDNDVCWLSRRRSQPRGVWRAEKDAKGEVWGTARLPFAIRLRSCLPVNFQPCLTWRSRLTSLSPPDA